MKANCLNRRDQRAKEEEKRQIDAILYEFIEKVGHEPIRELNLLRRKLRRLDVKVPIYSIYRKSLDRLLAEEYGRLSTGEITRKEQLPLRTMHEYRKEYYDKCQSLSKIKILRQNGKK